MAKLISKNTRNFQYERVPEHEEVEMVSSLLPQYEQVVERPVRQGETLRTIAIKYRISVSELKRVNRLEKDSEFYALSHIKIPVKANSLLGEILQEESEKQSDACHQNGSAVEQDQRRQLLSSCTDTADDSDPDTCVGYVSIQQILREKSTRQEARRFLENMQADLARIKQKVVSNKGSLSEAAAALRDPRFVPLSPQPPPQGGLSWWRLFLCAVLLLLLLPLGYFVYLLKFQ